MLMRAPLLRALAGLACALALAAGCRIAGAAGPWGDAATPVFRRAALPAGISPVTMLQDRSGMIWVGTQTGLVRWDGHQFQRDFGELAKRDDLRTAYISCLYEDDAGRLWIGTATNGVLRLDPRTGAVTVIGAGPQGLSGPQITAMTPDRKGGLWVGTDQGLNRLDLATGQVQRDASQGVPLGLPEGVGQADLLLDRRGDLWAATTYGLFVLRAGAPFFELVPLQARNGPAENIADLLEDRAGRLWIGTLSDGVFVRDPATGQVRRLLDGERAGLPPLDIKFGAMAEASNGEIWLTAMEGMLRADPRSLTARRLRTELADLDDPAFSMLFQDRSGLMWIGAIEMLATTNPEQRAVSTWHAGSGAALVMAVLARPDGSVWMADALGGIQVLAPDRRTIRRLPTQPGRPRHALPADQVLSMLEGPDGRVFIGTSNDLYVANADGSRVESLEVPGLPATQIKALCVKGDRLWIGSNGGLNYLELASPKPTGRRVVPNHVVNWLHCDSEDELLLGTTLGLFRYRPGTDVLDRPWPEDIPGRNGLRDGWITTLAKDHGGRLWVSIYGGGVCRLEPGIGGAQHLMRCLGHNEGIPDNAANAVALDAQGNAWVSTDNGLVRIHGDTLQAMPLQQVDGVGLHGHYAGAVTTTPEGDLVFGGKGLTIVRPTEYRPWTYRAPLVLTTVSEGRQPSGEIRLGPAVRAVQIGFALLDYSAPEQVRYAYRLAGLEEAWTDAATESRTARYNNIPPGHYAFEVRARNRAGEWFVDRWPLHVEPAWYETTSFRAAVAVAVLLALWGVLRLRTQWLVRRAALLHEQVAQRTQELQQRTEQLETSRQALRELGAHNTLLLEEERKRVARELHDELGQQLVAMRMEMSVLKARAEGGQAPDAAQWVRMQERVEQLTTSMRRLVQDLRPPALDGGLAPALQWLAAEYQRVSGISCTVTVAPEARTLKPEVKTMIFRVAQESLNNIARHSHATHVDLRLQCDDAGWDLRVNDDGIGFDTKAPQRGFGLLSMAERAQLMGGTLEIDSQPGKGTCVHLHVPIATATDAASS